MDLTTAPLSPVHSVKQAEDFVFSLFEAIDGRRWGELPSLFAPDCIYERPGYPAIVGIDALLHFYAHVRIVASGKHNVDYVTTRGDAIACWGRFLGVSREDRPIDELFADTYVLTEGGIWHRRTFFFRAAM